MDNTHDTNADFRISLTISEAVKATGISRGQFHKLLIDGALTRHKVGKRTLILRDELEAFIRSRPSTKWRGGRA